MVRRTGPARGTGYSVPGGMAPLVVTARVEPPEMVSLAFVMPPR